MSFPDHALTRDRFLGGKLEILQPKLGHRGGIDPVLLAASVQARANQTVLELGCGSGIASLCLGRRVDDLSITGIELQDEYAELATRNALENDIEMNVVVSDLRELPNSIKQQNFDHVFANPPYYRRIKGTPATDPGRDTSLAGDTPISAWVDVATRRLKPGGFLTIIQKADRTQDVLTALDHRLGSTVVMPISPRIGRPAELVLIRAKKGGRAAFRLLAPTILHRGTHHEQDGESYTLEIQAILRDGKPLEFG